MFRLADLLSDLASNESARTLLCQNITWTFVVPCQNVQHTNHVDWWTFPTNGIKIDSLPPQMTSNFK